MPKTKLIAAFITCLFFLFSVVNANGKPVVAQKKSGEDVGIPFQSEKEKLEAIKSIFNTNNFSTVIDHSNGHICDHIKTSIQSGYNIQAIEPIVRGEDYNAPSFQKYHLMCPALHLNHIAGDDSAGTEDDGDLLKNMQGYEVPTNVGNMSRKEYIFYAEGFKPSSGAPPDTNGTFSVGGYGGKYSVVNLKTCRIEKTFLAPSGFDYQKMKKTGSFTTLLSFKNTVYLLYDDNHSFYYDDHSPFYTQNNRRKATHRIYLLDIEKSTQDFHPYDAAICVYRQN